LPEPEPGLVIRYAYLWRSESERGQDEGAKDRPCAIVLATKRDGGKTTVIVAPITHSQPRDAEAAVEIPAATKARLRLDHQRSWVITNEVNVFTWPGPDLRPVERNDPARGFAYWHLPRGLTKAILESVRAQMRGGQAKPVSRDD